MRYERVAVPMHHAMMGAHASQGRLLGSQLALQSVRAPVQAMWLSQGLAAPDIEHVCLQHKVACC